MYIRLQITMTFGIYLPSRMSYPKHSPIPFPPKVVLQLFPSKAIKISLSNILSLLPFFLKRETPSSPFQATPSSTVAAPFSLDQDFLFFFPQYGPVRARSSLVVLRSFFSLANFLPRSLGCLTQYPPVPSFSSLIDAPLPLTDLML